MNTKINELVIIGLGTEMAYGMITRNLGWFFLGAFFFGLLMVTALFTNWRENHPSSNHYPSNPRLHG